MTTLDLEIGGPGKERFFNRRLFAAKGRTGARLKRR